MGISHHLPLALKALRELGPKQLGLYAWYRFGLMSGYLRWKTRSQRSAVSGPLSASIADAERYALRSHLLIIPTKEDLASVLGAEGRERLLSEADEIVSGQVRLFGGPPVPMRLSEPGPLAHWTAYEKGYGIEDLEDVKWIWEPARFGWAFILGRAYHLSGDEHYPESFWRHTEVFLEANPPYQGPHWASAQEAALRLVAFVYAWQVFAPSPQTTTERTAQLGRTIAAHAARIPSTLSYARTQNNNHLLIEAVGLFSAGIVLSNYPKARRWRDLGWRWLNHALLTQIAEDGTYIQHSTNYHRLMLHAALWANVLAEQHHEPLPDRTRQKLQSATRWLMALIDTETGRVPNLGPNDGANIFPLAACPFHDFRPVLQAAGRAFLGESPFDEGQWDELGLWFGARGGGRGEEGGYEEGIGEKGRRSQGEPYPLSPDPLRFTPHVLRNPGHDSWAYLRAAGFTSRPGHADQLHLDLWWRGLNVAQDAGTYSYNAQPPWDNSLSRSTVHNTLTIYDLDQMTRAGRFLWLDWAQAQVVACEQVEEGPFERLVARHDGYRGLGVIHQREVNAYPSGRWVIKDELLDVYRPSEIGKSVSQPVTFQTRLHWLLPDWPYKVIEESRESRVEIRLDSPYGWIALKVQSVSGSRLSTLDPPVETQIVRAGILLYGSGPVSPISGWASPNYGYKNPALSFSIRVNGGLPLSLVSEWAFPCTSS